MLYEVITNTDEEIKNLEILISVGKKLIKNVSKYERALSQIDTKNKTIKKIEPIKIDKITSIKKPKITSIDINDSKYTIKSVESRNNMIIIDFKTPITKDFVRFYEKNVKDGQQDIYDIKGRFKDAYPTKLSIPGVKQIVISQEDRNNFV